MNQKPLGISMINDCMTFRFNYQLNFLYFTSGQQAPGLLRDARYSGDKELDVSGANGVDTIQTRSDKWKAKHEAMLKLAVSPPGQCYTEYFSNTL